MSSDTVELVRRDRTNEFNILRCAAQRQSQWLNQRDSSIINNNNNNNNNLNNNNLNNNNNNNTPPWIRVITHCHDLEKTIERKLNTLQKYQTKISIPTFGDYYFDSSDDDNNINNININNNLNNNNNNKNIKMTEEELQTAITLQTKDIQKLLKELERMVKTGIRPYDQTNPDELTASENIKIYLSIKLNNLIIIFKDIQEHYANNTKKRKNRENKYKNISSEETHREIEQEEKISNYLELGYNNIDIQELLLEEERHQTTSNEVMGILEGIHELNIIFSELREIVVEQGTMLDRIDYRVDMAREATRKGLGQLREARGEQGKCLLM